MSQCPYHNDMRNEIGRAIQKALTVERDVAAASFEIKSVVQELRDAKEAYAGEVTRLILRLDEALDRFGLAPAVPKDTDKNGGCRGH